MKYIYWSHTEPKVVQCVMPLISLVLQMHLMIVFFKIDRSCLSVCPQCPLFTDVLREGTMAYGLSGIATVTKGGWSLQKVNYL